MQMQGTRRDLFTVKMLITNIVAVNEFVDLVWCRFA